MREPIRDAIAAGMPVYGTCAGLILLADRITDGIEGQQTFGGLDVTVQRNAFGSQVDSFETELDVPVLGEPPVHAVFIRAPLVLETGRGRRDPREPRRRAHRRGAAGGAPRAPRSIPRSPASTDSTSCSSTPCAPPDETPDTG